MKLYVIRHAVAIERGGGIADEDRYLTFSGRKSFRITAKAFAKKEIIPEYIVTSPLVRCVQTADILAEALVFAGELIVSRDLAPGFDLAGLYRIIAFCGKAWKVAIIGHEPDLGTVVEQLLKMVAPFSLKKGMVAALDFDPEQRDTSAHLLWIMHKGKKTASVSLGN